MKRLMEPLTRLPLAEAGEPLDEGERLSRVVDATNALKVDVPSLGALRASELATAEMVEENRLWLRFMLAERTQSTIFMAGLSRPEKHRMFLEDVRCARGQLSEVKWRIDEAISEACTPLDDEPDSEDASSIRTIRGRVRRHVRAGQLVIPTTNDGVEVIDTGAIPVALARGKRIRISAKVVRVERGRAWLQRVAISASARAQGVDPACIPRTCELRRNVHSSKHCQFGSLLQRSMDRRTTINLDVIVEQDWVTGAAVRLVHDA